MSPRVFPDRMGGRLCLDFVNTVDPRGPEPGRDYLDDFAAILDWCEIEDLELPRSVSRLRRAARSRPADAASTYRHAVAMREALYAVVDGSRQGARVARRDLAELNHALGQAIGHRVLTPDARGGVHEGWRATDDLAQVLWPVALDAWDLLTGPELLQVRQCPVDAGGCGRLFVDESRAGNRRWCDMRTCGNRVKARAHYSRATGSRATGSRATGSRTTGSRTTRS